MQQRNSLKVQKIQKTDSAFKSTLATFGKYGGFASRDKINFSSSKWIDVQPTALARRKVKCSDHLTNQAERPPKQAHTTEHDCSISTQLSSLMPRGKLEYHLLIIRHSVQHTILGAWEKTLTVFINILFYC